MKSASLELKKTPYLIMLWLFLFLFIPEIACGDETPVPGSFIEQKSQLKTIIVDDYYPYTFVNKEGVPDGFSVELVKAVTGVMGMNLEIRVDTWEQARCCLEAGDIDLLPMMAYSKERDRLFDFSVPHTIAYDAFFTRKDSKRLNTIEEFKGKTVIVMKGDQAHDYLRSSGLADSGHLILVDSLPEALRLLSSGRGDAALMPKLVGLMVMNDLNLTNLNRSPLVVESYNRPFSFAVKEGNQLLLERLSQGLSIIKNTGQYREIYDKWFGAVEPEEVTLKSVLHYLVGLFLALLLMGSAFALWSFSLRKQVALRTGKLEDEIAERRDAEMRFRQLTETIREVFWLGSLDWKEVYYISPAYEQVWGRQSEELYRNPMSWFESVVEEDRQKVRAAIPEVISTDTGEIVFPDYRIRRPDGSIAWISARAFPVPDDTGRPYRIAGIAEDITERKRTEQNIVLLNFALNNVHEAAFLIDEYAQLHYVNEYACRILGYTRTELLGLGVTDVDLDFPSERWTIHWNELKAKRSIMFEGRHRAKDGRIFPVEINANYFEFEGRAYNLALVRDITERRRAEEELRLAYEYIQQLISSANVMIIGLDSDGCVRMFNKAAEKITGYTIEELTGISWFEKIVPIDRYSNVWETFRSYQEKTGNIPTMFENPILTKSGEERFISWQNSTIPAPGSKISTISFGIDITERKRAEEELKRSNDMLRAIIEAAPVAIIGLDLDGNVHSVWNPAAEKMLGWSAREAMGRPLPSVPVERQDEFSRFREQIRSGKTLNGVEVRRKKRDGTPIDYSIYASPLHNAEGHITGNIAILVDITERRRTDEALRESEARLREAQRVGRLGNWEYNLQTTHFWGSDEARRIYGFDPRQDDFSTDEVENCIPERERVHQALIDLIEAGKVYDLEFEIHPRNSSESRIITSIAELQRDEHGNPLKVVGVIQDVTKRKQAEEEILKLNQELEQRVARRTAQLESANRELETFSYSVAHDLRAPLRGIDGFSQILLEKYQDSVDAQGKNYLQRVRSASQRMEQLIDDLLNLSRVSRSDMNIQQVNLSEVAQEIADELHRTHPERQVEFVIHEGIKAQGDGRLLRIVLENLMGNGWKFTSKHPTARIEFGMEQQKNTVYFVRDDGAGFDMKYGQKLFGAFQRLHSINEFSGTGIGLATVQRIIHRHCGKVWAEGKVEKGATFYFTIQ